MISFCGRHFPKAMILHAIFLYLRYPVSYRDLEEILAERGIVVGHATLNRWVVKYAPLFALKAQAAKRTTNRSWRMDETYIRVKAKWLFLYRAVDKLGDTLDFMLSERCNTAAATKFFASAPASNGLPTKVVIDKSGASPAGIRETNKTLARLGYPGAIQTIRSKYLNDIVEQDDRFIKRPVRPMCGFKSFRSASTTLEGIEVANMIRKSQLGSKDLSGFKQFAALAG